MANDLDRDWVPSGRPQSTMALNFSAALDDLFKIDGGLDYLSKNVYDKKEIVSTKSKELEELEAKLRETEKRLKRASVQMNQLPSPKSASRRTSTEDDIEDEDETSGAKGTQAQNSSVTQAAIPSEQQRINGTTSAKSPPEPISETPKSQTSHEYVMVDKP